MGDASGRPETSRDALIGKLALELRWVTPSQLHEALSELGADVENGRGATRSLGSILVARGILTATQLEQLHDQIRSSIPAFPPFGKYNVIREIGRGAAGVVYEAEDVELKRRVALKMLIAPSSDPEEMKPEHERFLRESQLHRSLPPHPGIVPVLEAGIIENRRYLAMDLVDGVSMGAWHKHGSITVRQRVALLRDVALAVHFAHQHGIVHRDLKPENVLVDRTHRARITDFGLAKLLGSSWQATATGTALGTPAYMSPEQVKGGRDVDARSDLYSLGVMLYEILTGRRPFEADSPYELMMKTVHEDVVPPSKITSLKINPVVYKNLENICLIALSKEPKDRYSDAESFARDLSKWLKGEDMRLVVPRRWRLWRSRKLLRALAAAAAVLALAAAGAIAWRFRETPESMPEKQPLTPSFIRAGSLQAGSIAEYYAGMNFNALGVRKLDHRSTFSDPALPLWREGPGYYTSRRWIGYLPVPSAGRYQFQVQTKEEARLLVDDVELYVGRMPATVPVSFREGVHRFVLEHAHFGAEDTVTIAWKKAGDSRWTTLGPGGLLHEPREFTAVQPQPAHRTSLDPVPGAEEGELLTILHDSGRKPARKTYGPFAAFWKGSWSGSEHLWWGSGVQPGDRLKVRFAAGETGPGTLAVGLTLASDHGIFKVRVNGVVVADALDLWSDDLVTRETEFQSVPLKAGANELEFEATGSNPHAREWAVGNGLHKLGIDYLLVR